ncbi:hypothetical protein SLEP1_g35442 [Rubroshorea leprosula]|uniref:Uncharacterized protein n=1 Tax=Rubroshorea leprosula TaxID=152421 RepID=A0AAV5KNA5_9ROSI|nr:hypothetical protein SLEP1_g35442 [Rubroshorea leprosula]
MISSPPSLPSFSSSSRLLLPFFSYFTEQKQQQKSEIQNLPHPSLNNSCLLLLISSTATFFSCFTDQKHQ